MTTPRPHPAGAAGGDGGRRRRHHGLLRQRMVDAFAWERRHYATAERLSAALDQVDIGIVLLDSDTRAEFINRAFRHYFSLPDEKADSKPPFIALMYHGRDTGAFELPEEELSLFIARRIEMMRSGDSDADQHQADGRTGAAFQLHRAARWRPDAELYARDRPGPAYRRSGQRRILPLAARRRAAIVHHLRARRIEAAGARARSDCSFSAHLDMSRDKRHSFALRAARPRRNAEECPTT